MSAGCAVPTAEESLARQEGLPWPEGDVAALKSASGAAQRVSAQASAAGRSLGHGGVAGWAGPAAAAYGAALGARAGEAMQVAIAFGTVAGAVDTLAGVITKAQAKVGHLATELHKARLAMEHAQTQAAGAQAAVRTAHGTDPGHPVPPALISAMGTADAAAGRAQTHYETLKGTALDEARQAVTEARLADEQAALTVDGQVGAAGGVGSGQVSPAYAPLFNPLLPPAMRMAPPTGSGPVFTPVPVPVPPDVRAEQHRLANEPRAEPLDPGAEERQRARERLAEWLGEPPESGHPIEDPPPSDPVILGPKPPSWSPPPPLPEDPNLEAAP